MKINLKDLGDGERRHVTLTLATDQNEPYVIARYMSLQALAVLCEGVEQALDRAAAAEPAEGAPSA